MNDIPKSSFQLYIINTFKELWRQRFYLYNELINNIMCEFGNMTYINQRTRENAQNFAYELQKYYGYYNAKIFESLLTEHSDLTVKLFKSIRARNTQSTDIVRAELYKNADKLAELFASVNPLWSKVEWQNRIYDHIRVIENEAINRLNTQCITGITYDEQTEMHIINIVNYLAEGIIRQFKI